MAVLPCGVHSINYSQDKAFIRTPPQWICFIAFLLIVFAGPFFLPSRMLGIIIITGITTVAVVGLQITVGLTGQINLGQSAFMGMGAFTTATLAANFNLPFWLSIPAGGIGGALLGAIFGIPALRVKGFYLALTTIAAQILFPLLITRMPSKWFGGANGLGLAPAKIGGFNLQSDQSLYYLIMGVTVIMLFFAFNLTRSRVGRALMAVRDNDIVAEIMGINLFTYKTLAFGIGSLFAGIAGGLWAYYIRYVMVDQFSLWFSVWYLGMIIVGGVGSILGAILGTAFLRALQELITVAGPWFSQIFPQAGGGALWFSGMNIILGGVIILFLIFEPKGLAHRWIVTSIISLNSNFDARLLTHRFIPPSSEYLLGRVSTLHEVSIRTAVIGRESDFIFSCCGSIEC
jgi:branched-chain amino acid transport system permease protein